MAALARAARSCCTLVFEECVSLSPISIFTSPSSVQECESSRCAPRVRQSHTSQQQPTLLPIQLHHFKPGLLGVLPGADQTDTAVLVAPVATAPVLDEIKGCAHVRLPNVREDTSRCIDGALHIHHGARQPARVLECRHDASLEALCVHFDEGGAAQNGISPLKIADGSHAHVCRRGKAAAAACQSELVHAVTTVGHQRSLLRVAQRCVDKMHRVFPQVGHVLLQVALQIIEGRWGGL
eukprot:scaffold16353_cov59-Phaeocystis_antarctica.AAC.3